MLSIPGAVFLLCMLSVYKHTKTVNVKLGVRLGWGPVCKFHFSLPASTLPSQYLATFQEAE